jgi:hypothetical protein
MQFNPTRRSFFGSLCAAAGAVLGLGERLLPENWWTSTKPQAIEVDLEEVNGPVKLEFPVYSQIPIVQQFAELIERTNAKGGAQIGHDAKLCCVTIGLPDGSSLYLGAPNMWYFNTDPTS